MNLTRYYIRSTVYPGIIVLVATIVFSMIENNGYQSEWLTAESVITLAIIVSFIYSLLLTTACLTIFFLKFKAVQNNHLLTLLSWFLLPFACIAISLVYEINNELEYEEDMRSGSIFLLILNLPYVVGLISTYISFKKSGLSPT